MIFDNGDDNDDENGDGGDEQNIFNLMICWLQIRQWVCYFMISMQNWTFEQYLPEKLGHSQKISI